MSGAFCGATVTPASRTVLVFFFASLILSLSHAALSAVLAVAPALLGEQLGSAACGTLFIAWVVSSLVGGAVVLAVPWLCTVVVCCGCGERHVQH